MNYSFKKLQLNEHEIIWLNQLYEVGWVDGLNVPSLKIKLRRKLPKNFNPENIDRRLTCEKRLSLIGLWYVDPDNEIFDQAEDVIKYIQNLIIENGGIDLINSATIEKELDIPKARVEILFRLINDIGMYFGTSGGSNDNDFGFEYFKFRNDDKMYDKFIHFSSLENEMEETFKRKASHKGNQRLIKLTDFKTGDYLPVQNFDRTENTWKSIHTDFEVSETDINRKLTFVKDEYKKQIILRDIVNAYLLAKMGFSKSAVILAGSVIEELLRIYLNKKEIKPKSNNFNSYIKCLEDQGIINPAITKLSDSVRDFRNLVHLERETDKKSAISKATATGAVSSIFTVINALE